MVPLQIQIVVKGLWQHAQWDPTSFFKTHILTNDAQELTPYRFELKTGGFSKTPKSGRPDFERLLYSQPTKQNR